MTTVDVVVIGEVQASKGFADDEATMYEYALPRRTVDRFFDPVSSARDGGALLELGRGIPCAYGRSIGEDVEDLVCGQEATQVLALRDIIRVELHLCAWHLTAVRNKLIRE